MCMKDGSIHIVALTPRSTPLEDMAGVTCRARLRALALAMDEGRRLSRDCHAKI